MGKTLDQTLNNAVKIPFAVDTDMYVIMSDQHIGDGMKGSDDFRLNCETYKRALAHYYDKGCRLVSIGDSEELWECDFPKIRRMYPGVYALEKKFSDSGRLFRLYGNHDIFWKRKSFTDGNLAPELPGITIFESLLLEGGDGRIFLTHGHQGEFFSDFLWPVSRFIVRNVWKPLQHFLGLKSTGAARDVKKRSEREQTYYSWAKRNRLLFVAGHTHRAMFCSLSKIDRLRMEIEQAEKDKSLLSVESGQYKKKNGEIIRQRAELQLRLEKEFGTEPEPRFEETGIPSPCYFNDGCCCYDNGITAIEIDNGMIRLVKWGREDGGRIVYEDGRLDDIFMQIGISS